MLVYVYNNANNKIELYNRRLTDPMPYTTGRTLTLAEFKSNSSTNILWTDRRAMVAWNTFRRLYGKGISVGYAFSRISKGGHTNQSQHYAGVAFDVGQNLSNAGRTALRGLAVRSRVWSYVEPGSLTPHWVHMDKRLAPPACAVGGYPAVRRGSKGVYVFVLQDALRTLGYTGAGLDGVFGPGTQRSVISFQASWGLPKTGVVDCNTWVSLTSSV